MEGSGIAVAGGNHPLQLRRAPGKLRNLADILAKDPRPGHLRHRSHPLGHPRPPHRRKPPTPHRDGTGTLVVVHNGIVENYLQLKSALIAKGHKFTSETDTEIIAHVIQDELELAYLSCHPERSEGSASVIATTDAAATNESQAVLETPTSYSLLPTPSHCLWRRQCAVP